MQNSSVNSPGFIDRQVEKLEALKGTQPIQNTPPVAKTDEAPVANQSTVIPNAHKEAVKELVQNGAKPVPEVAKPAAAATPGTKNNTPSTAGVTGEEGAQVEEKEILPSQERVDLDKNKEKPTKKETKKVDAETEEHLKWLNDGEVKPKGGEEEKNKSNYEEEIKSYKTKVQDYESVLNDDYVKALVEFRKTGGTDLTEFSRQLGIVDVNKLTIEDFYAQKAADQGLKDDVLTEAVSEAVERYNALPKLDQAEILNNFKNNVRGKTEEKLKSFSSSSQAQRQKDEAVKQTFFADLDKEVSVKVGKKFRGLLIDEKMSKEIKQAAPNYSIPKFDKDGNFVGYDAEHGVEMAIYLPGARHCLCQFCSVPGKHSN